MRVYHFMRYKWWFLGSLTAVTVFAVIAIFDPDTQLLQSMARGEAILAGQEAPHDNRLIRYRAQ